MYELSLIQCISWPKQTLLYNIMTIDQHDSPGLFSPTLRLIILSPVTPQHRWRARSHDDQDRQAGRQGWVSTREIFSSQVDDHNSGVLF